jgi:hypothetical protein
MSALRRFIVIALHNQTTIALRSVLAETPIDAINHYQEKFGKPQTLDLFSEREWLAINDRLSFHTADALPPHVQET